MTETVVTIENNLVTEKRDMNVYHQATRSAHIISHGNAFAFPLGDAGDYLHLSVVRGPGRLWSECVVELPMWADFELSVEGPVTVNHGGRRTRVNIPPGPPSWQLKITRPSGRAAVAKDRITISARGGG